MDIKNKIKELTNEIYKYNEAYYKHSKSLVSDYNYDIKLAMLRQLEKKYPQYKLKNSPTNKVASDSLEFFSKSIHEYIMLSLENTYNKDEVDKFISKSGSDVFNIEDKIDGLALSLVYENGKLIRGVTRGNGKIGDDVTCNVMKIKNIPKTIPIKHKLEIRGEVCIYKKQFEKINKEGGGYANARNLASGTLKLHYPHIVKERKLKFIAYEVLGTNFTSQSDKLIYLRDILKFRIPKFKSIYIKQGNIMDLIAEFEADKDNRKYEVDGAVIKVNSVETQNFLGISTGAPKWAVAYKFNAEQAITKLLSVEYNIGRTGVITPVANLEPVLLCGTTIKRATLHNFDFILGLDLHINDDVIIEKGGEIIPKVVAVHKFNHFGDTKFWIKQPEFCPLCSSRLVKEDGEAKLYCPDEFGTCHSQFIGRLAHFASRDALDIKGLGEETCKLLVTEGLVSSFKDLYELQPSQLLSLEGFAKNSAEKLVMSIQKSLKNPIEKFIFGFGIPKVGELTAVTLAKEFKTFYRLQHLKESDISKISGFGDVLAGLIVKWFSNPTNKTLIKDLKALGMPKRYINKTTSSNNILNGKNIAITGNFGQHSRDYLSNIIENLGGIYNNSVKKTTNILLTGDDTGKKKLEKATEWNIQILSKTESLKLLQL